MSASVMKVVLALAANAIGLLVAALVLDKMSMDFVGFLVAVVVFTVVEALAAPLIRKLAERYAAGLTGLVALVATWVGLLIADLISDGFEIEGFVTWILATVIVWFISLVGAVVLPRLFLKESARA